MTGPIENYNVNLLDFMCTNLIFPIKIVIKFFSIWCFDKAKISCLNWMEEF